MNRHPATSRAVLRWWIVITMNTRTPGAGWFKLAGAPVAPGRSAIVT
jgi:hypothetical protein